MKRVELGKTGIEVSRLGIGTGTGLPSGHCAQALMDKNELARLLLYALDRGINLWDTAFQYNTYPHIKEALKQVGRKDVVLTTKFSAANEKETIRDFNITLKDLNIDYVDMCSARDTNRSIFSYGRYICNAWSLCKGCNQITNNSTWSTCEEIVTAVY